MKVIHLTKGGETVVDDSDYDDLMQFHWRRIASGRTFYAARDIKIAHNKYRVLRLHQYLYPNISPLVVDHIDRNGLNNQRSNLRVVHRKQNCQNKTSGKNSSSRYMGVSWYKNNGKWRVQIESNGKNRHVGYYDNEIDAALAYNVEALKEFGEFAALNTFDDLSI